MGNCVSLSISLDQSVNKVSQWLEENGGYTHNLEKNLVALKTTMEELTAKRDDLSRKVTREEDRGLQRLAKFQVWLNRFETIEKEVIDILGTGNVQLQRLCLCGFCSKSLLSSYRYGKTVFLKLREVEKLKSEVFDVIVDQVLIPEVEERPLQPTIVGQETMLDKAWKHLMEDGVGGVMGVYGMGGVGKTTLLTQLNNKFNAARCGFDFVIWTVVSKELQVEKILNDIAQKVDLGGEMWNQKSTSQKVVHLFNFLKKKKFVLFLDDIWEKVELAEIGIPVPTPQNRCKVVFSTRSQDVCAHMGVEKPMEVQCLADNDAFDLFQKKVGQTTLGSDSGIPDLARIVAKKCCGLPLALNVIGETMSCKRTIQEWHHAIHVLNSYAAEFSGMDDKILPLLKYSYDSLKGEQVKSCLLYCALFPEDARVAKEKLIEYWICEEIIDGSEGIDKAENHGYEIIGTLVRASLLMEAATDQDGVHIVHMHDVVREMALWIASEMGIQKEAFIVRAGVGLHEIPKIKNWRVVKRMSLMNNKISHLTSRPVCIELTTLLLQSTNLEDISSEFFKSMPKLVVLDLSDNYYLYELPVISKLVSLQYLNLSGTGIRDLPTGLQELKKLIHLDLEKTRHLSSIVGLSSLDNLKVLKLSGSQFPWDHDTVKELEALEDLELVTTTIDRTPSKENILRSHRLMSCSQSLKIMNNSNLKSSEILLPAAMDKLRDFSIKCCTISEIKMGRICSFLSLVKVRIEDCKCLRELTFLMFAPNLRILFVEKANQLEDIISKEKVYEGIVPFAKLNNLHLADLPQLKNIYWSPLPFPCLQNLYVKACPNLKKLPLDSLSGKHGENGLIIGYRDMEWFCNVKWEDHATKTRFSSSSRRQGYNRIFISYVEKKWIERTRS